MSGIKMILEQMQFEHLTFHRPAFGGQPSELCKFCEEDAIGETINVGDKVLTLGEYDHIASDVPVEETEDYE